MKKRSEGLSDKLENIYVNYYFFFNSFLFTFDNLIVCSSIKEPSSSRTLSSIYFLILSLNELFW